MKWKWNEMKSEWLAQFSMGHTDILGDLGNAELLISNAYVLRDLRKTLSDWWEAIHWITSYIECSLYVKKCSTVRMLRHDF